MTIDPEETKIKYKVLANCKVDQLEELLNKAADEGWAVFQMTPTSMTGTARKGLEEELNIEVVYHVVMVQTPPMQQKIWNELVKLANQAIFDREMKPAFDALSTAVKDLKGKIKETKEC